MSTGMQDDTKVSGDDPEYVDITLDDDDGDEAASGVNLEQPYKVKVNGEGDDDGDGEGDERLESGQRSEKAPNNETEEEKRERRRKERKEKNERKKQYRMRDELVIQSMRQENEELKRTIGEIQKKMAERDITDTETALQHCQSEALRAARVKQQAIQDGDGEKFARAEAYERQAWQKANQLAQFRRNPAPAPQSGQSIDPVAAEFAKQFLTRHDFYSPNANDDISRTVQALDNGVARDGYDPRTPEYWEELEARMRRRLPANLFKDDGDDDGDDEPEPAPKRKGPPVAGKPDTKTNGRTITIPREFREALQEAGLWDDPKRRNRAIKEYLSRMKGENA